MQKKDNFNYVLKLNSMKVHLTFLFTALCLSTTLISCDKPLASYNSEFVGKWRSDVTETSGKPTRNEIIIEGEDGIYNAFCTDTCETQLCDCIVSQTGKAVINTDKTMVKFGSANSTPLKVNQEPTLDASGTYIMEIGGVLYRKQ